MKLPRFLPESLGLGYPGSICLWGDPTARWSHFVIHGGYFDSTRTSVDGKYAVARGMAMKMRERIIPKETRRKFSFWPMFSNQIHIKKNSRRYATIGKNIPYQRWMKMRRDADRLRALADKQWKIGNRGYLVNNMRMGHPYMPREVWD